MPTKFYQQFVIKVPVIIMQEKGETPDLKTHSQLIRQSGEIVLLKITVEHSQLKN